ncbi:MAG: response regulator [Acidobacteria bacterium]|nr:response regulator [Acidobacteriota bacterium]
MLTGLKRVPLSALGIPGRLVWATAAGVAGLFTSYLAIPVVPGVTVVLSGVFYLLSAISMGPFAGMLSAAIAASRTPWQQGHPWGYLLTIVEAGLIGWAVSRRKLRWPPAAAMLFWLLIGAPYLYTVCMVVAKMNPTIGWTIVLKNVLVGVVDASVADFLLMLPLAARNRLNLIRMRPAPIREALATGLLAMTLLPMMLYAVNQCRLLIEYERRRLTRELSGMGAAGRAQVDKVIRHELDGLLRVAEAAGDARSAIARTRRAQRDLVWLAASDADGRTLAEERAPEGGGLAPRKDLLARTLAQGRPILEAVPHNGGALLMLSVAGSRSGGRPQRIVQGAIPLASLCVFNQVLVTQELVVLDEFGRLLCPSPSGADRALDPAAAARYSAATRRADGTPVYVGFQWKAGQEPSGSMMTPVHSGVTGWSFVASQPLASMRPAAEAHYLQTLEWLAGLSAVLCILAALLAHHIAAPIEVFVASLRSFQIEGYWEKPFPSDGAPPELLQIQEQFGDLSNRLADTGAATRRALAEKDLLNEKLQRLLAELDRKVQGRTSELSEARARAEAANEAKSLFLASMSHEIRTPLNAIIGVADLLASHNLGAEEQSLNEMIRVSSRGLMALINDILDFSKIESGKLELGNISFDPRDIAESVASVVALAAQEKGVEIACRVGRDVPKSVLGDPDRLQQVLMNLASNAVKFTLKGHVAIVVEALERNEHAVTLRIQVEDTGVGIPRAARGRLFRPFSQADASTTREFGGTGLGLAVCKSLTEHMGGEIGFESEEGRGSTFWCQFTFVLPEQEPKERAEVGIRSRILVVDDSRISRLALVEALASLGLEAEAVGGPREAMEALELAPKQGRPYGVALIDFGLPEWQGIPLTAAIRATAGLENLPLVLLRAQNHRLRGPEHEGLLRSAPLRKPVLRRKLIEALLDVGLSCPDAPAAMAAARSPRLPTVQASECERPRILLVEDNVVNQRVASKMLDRLGYDSDVASNGVAALEALEGRRYNLVLMDCQMPVMDGFEATREIRRRGNGLAGTVIIAMTANAYAEDRERCRQAGMDDYLAKPVALDSLAAALERWTRPKTLAGRVDSSE